MKIQTLVEASEKPQDVLAFLKERYPEKYELIENWEELSFKADVVEAGDGQYVVILEVPDEDFSKAVGIFPSKEEAKGAFLTTALEKGWEEFPESYIIYHAQFEGDKLIAGIKDREGISKHDQMHLEQMIQKIARYPRVIAYSTDVLTYIKDLYPDVDTKAYIVSREIAKVLGKAPDLEDLGKIYGVDTSSLEGKLNLIEKLLENPVRTPEGTVNIRPYYLPLT